MSRRVEFTLPDGYTTAIEAVPGYDFRDDPAGCRGCAGLSLVFVLRAPDGGGITWELLTGWMARPVREPGWSIFAHRVPSRGPKPGLDLTGHAPAHLDLMAGAVDLHHPQQLKDWWAGPDTGCRVTGDQCWGDRGYSVGDRVLEALIADGDPGVWRELLDLYQAWTAPDEE